MVRAVLVVARASLLKAMLAVKGLILFIVPTVVHCLIVLIVLVIKSVEILTILFTLGIGIFWSRRWRSHKVIHNTVRLIFASLFATVVLRAFKLPVEIRCTHNEWEQTESNTSNSHCSHNF